MGFFMTKRLHFYFLALMGILPTFAFSQFETIKDSVVDLYGIVMTADSLKALQGSTVEIKTENRMTTTNESGLFHILAKKGDRIQFTYVGYKPQQLIVPSNIPGNQYSVIVTMVNDTQYLPVTIVRARPTRAQFERDFVNKKLDDSLYDVAKQNTSPQMLKKLSAGLAWDGKEAADAHLTSQAQMYYSSGQAPRQNIFDLVSWKNFFQAWKRGDFKKQNN
jgi:CarboxypepD_reg-like domain